jgi:hypothetical protein
MKKIIISWLFCFGLVYAFGQLLCLYGGFKFIWRDIVEESFVRENLRPRGGKKSIGVITGLLTFVKSK